MDLINEMFSLRLTKKCSQYLREFDFSGFISRYLSNEKEITRFWSALLYGLYYGDIDLSEHITQNHREYLLLQVLAENVSSKSLRKVILGLTPDKQITLICYVFKHYREGSYQIIKCFREERNPDFGLIKKLISGLKRKYYSISKLSTLLLEKGKLDNTALQDIIEALEEDALSQTQEFYTLFNELIPLMVSSPLRVFETLENLKQQNAPLLYQPNVKGRKKAEKEERQLEKLFASFLRHHYSLDDFLLFVRLYGLEGHQPFLRYREQICGENTLVSKTRVLHMIFNNPLLLSQISQKEVIFYFSLAFAIVGHLEAMFQKPSKYKKALKIMTCAMPTKGKSLEFQSSLPSMLDGLQDVVEYLKRTLKHKVSISDVPIYVYDQSDKALFNKNQAYIETLNQYYKSSVVHVSQKDALALAKKIGIERFLNTTGTGAFGYGGTRNCVFLLTPVFRHAFDQGKRFISEVLNMEDDALKTLFQEFVCGSTLLKRKHFDAIFMCDDDMEIPECNLFSHLLYAEQSKHHYTAIQGYHYGRDSKTIHFLSLDTLLNNPCHNSMFIKWLETPIGAAMSEYISKARFCLNLPFGAEEGHLILSYDTSALLQPSIHLSGTRYPDKQIPTHFFVGIESSLQKFLPYAFHVKMVQDLVDPLNKHNSCVLPWNDAALAQSFHCLNDVLMFIAKGTSKKEMQNRFWNNVCDLFSPEPKRKYLLREILDDIRSMDVDAMLKAFANKQKLDTNERKSLAEIGKIYKFYQEDARYLWAFATQFSGVDHKNVAAAIELKKNDLESKNKIKFENYPLTQGVYQLFCSIGAGEFCDIVGDVVASFTNEKRKLCS